MMMFDEDDDSNDDILFFLLMFPLAANSRHQVSSSVERSSS